MLHGNARTTPRIRAERQASQDATRVLAKQDGLNPKTVAKWRQRTTTADEPMGPRARRKKVLTEAAEQLVVEFRRRTHLPLDDQLGCLHERVPALTRSARHRCLQRHGVSRLPTQRDGASKRGRFADTTSDYSHVDSCAVRAADGKRHRFVAVDRVTTFT